MSSDDSSPRRTILHVDMDAFFVSVELLDRPDLRGRPVVVGGSGRRGVIAAASYPARRYGVHSAMSTARARQLCPDLVVLDGHHERYVEVSRRLMTIFGQRTPLVEPISLDEAFLDVTGARRLLGDGVHIAGQLREEVRDTEGLECSVGVASTKFVAKLASQQAKPRPGPDGTTAGAGVLLVEDDNVLAFLHPLPVSALWGVGPATLSRLTGAGLIEVGDLARTPVEVLVSLLGESAGRHLHQLAHGVDDRAVVADREAKSVGHEQTYSTDLVARQEMDRELLRLADAVAARLAPRQLAGATVTLKVRFGDFTTITRSHTPRTAVASTKVLAEIARQLALSIDPAPGIRLLGVSVSGLVPSGGARQLTFDEVDVADPDGVEVQRAVDAIRERWGPGAIGPAALLDPGGLQLRRRGDAPWGPSEQVRGDDRGHGADRRE